MVIVNPKLVKEIKKLGAFDISACYSCGTCTAICPLSEENHEFPRKLIRYAMVGNEEKLVMSVEPWLCYYCGECSESCPRQADPGGFMMAVRRYQTIYYSWNKIARFFYSKSALVFILSIFTIFQLAMFYMFHGPMINEYPDIYSFISYDLIHYAGIVAGVFIVLSAIINISIMYNYVKRSGLPNNSLNIGKHAKEFVTALKEALLQQRFNKCSNTSKLRYIAHLSLFWGFLGLFIATSLHYIGDILSIHVDVIYPRILGILSGVLLMYGSLYFIYKRLEKKETYAKYSHFSDWLFLILLFMTGLTGFLIDIFLYTGMAFATYITYAIHLMFIFDLLITAPFTKFAHAIFRPFALYLKQLTQQ
jgi:ferredoxin